MSSKGQGEDSALGLFVLKAQVLTTVLCASLIPLGYWYSESNHCSWASQFLTSRTLHPQCPAFHVFQIPVKCSIMQAIVPAKCMLWSRGTKGSLCSRGLQGRSPAVQSNRCLTLVRPKAKGGTACRDSNEPVFIIYSKAEIPAHFSPVLQSHLQILPYHALKNDKLLPSLIEARNTLQCSAGTRRMEWEQAEWRGEEDKTRRKERGGEEREEERKKKIADCVVKTTQMVLCYLLRGDYLQRSSSHLHTKQGPACCQCVSVCACA